MCLDWLDDIVWAGASCGPNSKVFIIIKSQLFSLICLNAHILLMLRIDVIYDFFYEGIHINKTTIFQTSNQ